MKSNSPTRGSPSELSGLYDREILSTQTVASVAAKEKVREYPLDRLNDMRALINYGPEFSAQCVTHRDELLSVAGNHERMAIGRLLRIHMALMCALGTLSRLGSRDTAVLKQLGTDLGSVLVQRVRSGPLMEDMSTGRRLERIPAQAEASGKHALNIGWKCAELADRLGMGEHVIHAHSHVEITDSERTIRRAFFHQRRNHYFPYRVVIGTVLTPESDYSLDAPLFRARARDAVPPQDRNFLEVMVEGTSLTDLSSLQRVDALVSSALQSVCAHEERAARVLDMDVRKMLIYSAELRDAHRAQGRIWRLPGTAYEDIAQRRVTRQLGLDDEQAFGPTFFELIEEGVNTLRSEPRGSTS
ncbi:hypothetical protein [Streptomyces griseoluteus]|uniref:hypothetical protein n=1 Tax=Streptomyces griseoluteus TaxID=29306 RepID=UPI0034320083